MLFSMPKITFFLRSNNDKIQSHVLYCRVWFNGTKTEFSLKEKLKPCEWSQENQCFKGSKAQTKYIELLLENVKYKLKAIALIQEQLSAKELVNALTPKQEKFPLLSSIVEKYILAVEKKCSPGTLRNHNVKLANLISYQEHTKTKFTTESFSLVDAEKFKEWFQSSRRTENVDTANRNVLLFRSACVLAQKRGEIKTFPLIHFRGEKDPIKKPVFLTADELKKIEGKELHSKMLLQIRDVFLFQCYTGLAYADIWSNWQIKETESGNILIGTRNKNQQAFFVPIEAKVIDLLEKYAYKLPTYSNEVFNRVLKELAAVCDIDKRITTHTSRKTFATLRDSDGWTRETVSQMLGHRSIKTTEIYYLGESSSRIETEMKKRG